MLDDAALDAGDRWVDDWQTKIEARLQRTRALAAGLRDTNGVGRSGDGLIKVTVDSSGALLELHLNEDVRRHSARWIAEQVVATAQLARADLSRAATEVAQQLGETDSPESQAVLKALSARFGEAGR